MKHLPITFLFAFALLFGGCVNTSQETAAFKTLGAVGYTVDGAMKTYSDAVVAGHITPGNQNKVANLFNRYQPLYNASVRAARSDLTALAPEELAAIAAELTTLILKAIP